MMMPIGERRRQCRANGTYDHRLSRFVDAVRQLGRSPKYLALLDH